MVQHNYYILGKSNTDVLLGRENGRNDGERQYYKNQLTISLLLILMRQTP